MEFQLLKNGKYDAIAEKFVELLKSELITELCPAHPEVENVAFIHAFEEPTEGYSVQVELKCCCEKFEKEIKKKISASWLTFKPQHFIIWKKFS